MNNGAMKNGAMKNLRPMLLALAFLTALPLVVQASIQQTRAQITVTITINVTPSPMGTPTPMAMVMPAGMPGVMAARSTEGSGIVARLILDPSAPAAARAAFRAENLQFDQGTLVAQSANQQKAVKVEAEISPNPTATLLYSDQSGVQVSQTAGTTEEYVCLYHVTVDTTVANWSLEHGLFSDFLGGNGDSFPGKDVGNNSYLTTPHPAYTPFVVYSDGQNWQLLQANGGEKTYCVSLQIAIPAATAQGAYSSQATYTLLY
jgi:hypothetical protein